MLEVGALTTMTPAWVAALTSTLSRPTPARATTLSCLAAASASASTLVARADQDRVDVGDGREQLGAVGAVAVPDLEVGAEGLDGGGRELFGDEDDGLGHGDCPSRLEADGRLAAQPVPVQPRGDGTALCPSRVLERCREHRTATAMWTGIGLHAVAPVRSHRVRRGRDRRVSGRRCPRRSRRRGDLTQAISLRSSRPVASIGCCSPFGAQRLELRRAGVLVVDEPLGEGAVLDVGEDGLHVLLHVRRR